MGLEVTGDMGHIHQSVELRAKKSATVRMLVDTGATFSVIPDRLARAVGIKRLARSVAVRLADGRRVRLDAGVAIFRIDGREAPATILVGEVAEPVLGVETLEALGLTVDPRRRRLTPSRDYAVRLGGYR
ncbi:MAG: retroviral-like aspartic protease family protein [Dehalococcoidia bacterium]|nr:retroviral-like aspartic protease family protein [Dehalococcoidia bacterium]